jgi:1-acyl-sn-glycerol-3-phosphate acyltransferase
MESIFLFLYDYFKTRKTLVFSLFIILFLIFGFCASRIKIEEDISKFFPVDKELEKVNQAFQGSRFAEKLVVMVSLKDSTSEPQPDQLIQFTDNLVVEMQTSLSAYVSGINYRVDDELIMKTFDLIYKHLPVFLNEQDYAVLDSIIQPQVMPITLASNYRQLISPAGMAMKKIIVKDPVGVSRLVLKKLQDLQVNDDFELYDNYYFTKDHRYLLFFVTPVYPTNDTGNNLKFLQQLDETIARMSVQPSAVTANYFGAVAVAAGNAKQLRADTILTLSLTVVLLIIFLFGFLRKVSAPLIILIPVLFGGLFSLTLIWLIQGTISVLAIAAGSIVLGIAINYSLHFFSHLKETGDVRHVVKDLVTPMTIGSATTVLAFLSLQFTNASMLSDIGLFAGFSLIGAALCSLIFLPHLLKDNFFGTKGASHIWQTKLFFLQPKHTRYLIPIILLLTPVMLYFANKVQFNSDMTKLNYMSPELKKTEATLNRLVNFNAQAVFVVTDGTTLEQALRENEAVVPQMEDLKRSGTVKKYASVSSFLISDSLQRVRLARWNAYWTQAKKDAVMSTLRKESEKLRFTKASTVNFDSLLNRTYVPTTGESFNMLRQNFFEDYLTEKNGLATIVTSASIDPSQSNSFYKTFENHEHVSPFDKRMLTKMFVSFVHADFTFIVTVTSLIVFLVLLLSYGRIELTLMAFAPMLITWIWILGIMALLGIEFNIVNVMISTFIFGLGDDYSIFIMDGLLKEYKTGEKTLGSVQDSIFLSAITTISGLGVLIFAQHPALKSIAAISIIGILMVWVMSQTLGPFLFAKMISNRAKKKLPPTTLLIFIFTYVIYFAFVSGALILTVIGFFQFKVLRLTGPRSKYCYHFLLRFFTGVPIYMAIHYKKRILNWRGQYQRPRIIISNHQSFIDILVTCMLNPKVVLLTNRWVWNSPIFGWVVKMADFYPVDFGVEGSVEPLRKMVDQGYSIMVFPEGTRSFDGEIKRFHKGAFYLSEKLQLDVLPLLIHGSGDCIRKNDLNMHYATLTMKFLNPIRYDDASFGVSYSEKAKNIGHHFKSEYQKLKEEVETPYALRHYLISNFLYKGPVLEWYMRIKIRLEDYYEPFHKLIPKNASVLDLGCGYGFLSYMLHFLSKNRKVTGVDYDDEKIAVAAHGYLKGETLSFACADVTQYPIQPHDAIIISDVLHYLSPGQQDDLLKKCFQNLNAGGVLIIRDGDQDIEKKHGTTKITEFFSIKLLGFNRSNQPLNFISGGKLRDLAERSGMEIETISNQKFTSNVIFAVRKKVR